MKDTKLVIATIVRIIIALAGIACIIISMILDQTTPYLAMGLGLTAVANIINCCAIKKMRGNKDGSAEDRCIS